jgi:ArsR family transcriptional regulator
MHADLCKVFSNPVRVGLLVLLKDGERSVGSLARDLRVSVPTASKHLRVMRDRGVLQTRRDGNVVYYQVPSPKVLRAFSLMREVLLARVRATGRVVKAL